MYVPSIGSPPTKSFRLSLEVGGILMDILPPGRREDVGANDWGGCDSEGVPSARDGATFTERTGNDLSKEVPALLFILPCMVVVKLVVVPC